MEHTMPLANNHISVDCVVFGFDGEQLKVLLVNFSDTDFIVNDGERIAQMIIAKHENADFIEV